VEEYILGKSFTLEEVREYIESCGCKLLSDYYKNNITKLNIIGVCGHEYIITLNEFRNSGRHSCPACGLISKGMKKRLTYEYVKQYIESKGCELITKEYSNCQDELEIKFSCGHVYKKPFTTFQCSTFLCPVCAGGLKHDKDAVLETVEMLGLYYIGGEYIGKGSKLSFIDDYGYIYDTSPDNIIHNFPNNIDNRNIYALYNLKLWIKQNKVPLEIMSEKYIDASHKLDVRCLNPNCNETWKVKYANISSGQCGCPYCAHRYPRTDKSNSLANMNPILMEEWDCEKNDFSPYDVLPSSNKYAFWICRNCGNSWNSLINSRSGKKSKGCPKCKESHAEKQISDFLKEKEAVFVRNKSFEGCRYKHPLKFDFYLPKYNICLEANGEQHYSIIKFFHRSNDDFEDQQIRDELKRKFCKENNINLIEIPYTEYKNIEKILTETLNL